MRRRGVRGALGFGLAAVAALTALSFCGALYYPADLFSHFRLHIAGFALLLAACLLLVRARTPALLAGGLIAVNLLTAMPVRSVTAAPVHPGDLELTVVTFNIWGRNGGLDAAARMLEQSEADIVLLQEVGPRATALLATLGRTYPWRHDCGQVDYCDLAILSRHRWVEAGMARPTLNQPSLLWARFERAGRPVTIATTHLNRPPWPIHLHQIDGLARNLANIRGPLVLGGDFNAAPWSYAVTRLIGATGLAPLAGLRPTWPAILGLPQLPIDHILVSDGIRNLGAERGPYAGSDHLPVIARVAIGEEADAMRR